MFKIKVGSRWKICSIDNRYYMLRNCLDSHRCLILNGQERIYKENVWHYSMFFFLDWTMKCIHCMYPLLISEKFSISEQIIYIYCLFWSSEVSKSISFLSLVNQYNLFSISSQWPIKADNFVLSIVINVYKRWREWGRVPYLMQCHSEAMGDPTLIFCENVHIAWDSNWHDYWWF